MSNPPPNHPPAGLAQLFAQAVQLHGAGRLAEADRLYAQVLAQQPAHTEALRFRGLVLQALGRPADALQALNAAVAANPKSADVHFSLGNLLAAQGRFAQATAAYQSAVILRPNFPDALCNLGNAHAALGEWRQAADVFRQALRSSPRNATLHNNLSIALLRSGDPPGAIDAASCAAALDPQSTNAALSLGDALQSAGRVAEAVTAYRRAADLAPNDFDAQLKLGTALVAAGDPRAAEGPLQHAVALNPNSAAAPFALGNARLATSQWAAARQAYERCLELNPGEAGAWHNIAVTLRQERQLDAALSAHQRGFALASPSPATRIEHAECLMDAHRWAEAEASLHDLTAAEPGARRAWLTLARVLSRRGASADAEAALQRAIALAPTEADAHTLLGNVLADAGKVSEATASYRRAVACDPGHPTPRTNLALLELLAGDFARGWADYEARTEAQRTLGPDWVRWHARLPLEGRSLLVHAEQGLGDTLQFARYIPVLAARGARVCFVVHPPLEPLLAGMPGAERVIAHGDPVPRCDYFVPLLSLPFELGTTIDSIPPVVPPLVSAGKRLAWETRLPREPKLPRVGVVWSGRPTHVNDHNRSIAPATFRQIFDALPDVPFYSLQKNPTAGDTAVLKGIPNLANIGPEFADFVDTAAAIAALDLVITVDTAVAHLAGTMGKPVWVLLPFVPDFRWLLDRPDSPWYPTAKLFRQPEPGDWISVLDAVVARLRRYP